jgi:hypothetical protein
MILARSNEIENANQQRQITEKGKQPRHLSKPINAKDKRGNPIIVLNRPETQSIKIDSRNPEQNQLWSGLVIGKRALKKEI